MPGTISKLRYGTGFMKIPSSRFSFLPLFPEEQPECSLTPRQISERIDSPIGARPIEETHRKGESVLIVLSDATRVTGTALFLPQIIERLLRTGIQEKDIRLIFATGVHRKVTEDEKASIAGKEILARFLHIDHDPDSGSASLVGLTSRGTRVRINGEVFRSSRLILTGSVDFHYHAGFSGGRKALVPGLAHRETASSNHQLYLSEAGRKHPHSDAGILGSNPVHEDMLEGALMLPPAFIVNSIVSEGGGIEEIFAGHMVEAHLRAAEFLKRARSVKVQGKRRIVVAGCGGYPKDMNFVQANKSIQNCARLVEDGGVLVLVAQCSEGYGNADFARWLSMERRTILSEMKRDFRVYAQTAISIINVLERITIILVSDFKAHELKNLGIIQADSLEDAFSRAEEFIGRGAHGYTVEHGGRWLFQ